VTCHLTREKGENKMATVTNSNAKAKAGNGLGTRTRIINLAKSNMTQADLDAAILYLSQGETSGTDDAHTVAGISVLTESGVFTSGTTDDVQVAVQGTGVLTVGSNFGVGSTGVTASLIAEFNQ